MAATGANGGCPARLSDWGIIMRKPLVAALLSGASIIGLSAGSVFAGETTGNGGTTPIAGTVAPFPGVPASICAFSGLEDAAGAGPGETQTPANEGEPGEARICSVLNRGKGWVTPTGD